MKLTGLKIILPAFVALLATSLSSLAALDFVRIGPLPFSAATGVTVESRVADNRPDISLEYRWFINDEEQFFEKSAQLSGHLFKRGDIVAVEVIPVTYAGERLTPVVSRPFEAVNAPPTITSEPPEELSESGFRYQVTAVDPDGDPLTFRLEAAPDDMTINASSGLITWGFDVMPEGNFPVSVVVDDGQGGQDEQFFELQMSYEEVSL